MVFFVVRNYFGSLFNHIRNNPVKLCSVFGEITGFPVFLLWKYL